MPQCSPAATKPAGAVTLMGYMPTADRPAVSGRPRARLAHCTAWPLAPLTRLSMAHSDDDPARAVVGAGSDVRGVRTRASPSSKAASRSRRRTARRRTQSCNTSSTWSVVDRVCRPGVTGGEDAAVHRREMRREQHLRIEALLDLRACDGGRAARTRRSPRRSPQNGYLSRPAPDTPLAASTMMPSVSTRPARTQRRERQGGRSRIAAGRGDEAGGGDRVTMQLGQAVHEVRQQIGRLVLLAVPLRVQRRVAETEVGGEIDDVLDRACGARASPLGTRRGAARRTRGRVRRRSRVRRARTPGTGRRPPGSDTGRRPSFPPVCHRWPARRQVGMSGAQAQQLRPREPRRSDDPDADHRTSLARNVHDHASD